MDRARTLLLLATLSVLVPAPAWAAEEGSGELRWREEWPRFRTWEYALTGAALVTTGVLIFAVDWPASGEEAENPIDEAGRDAFRARDFEGREVARYVGDAGFRFLLVYPVLDAVAVAWIGHGSPDVAGQMLLIDAQSIGISAALSLGIEKAGRRSRPSTEPCENDPDYEYWCDGSEEYASFYSGHMAMASTGAGLTCAHHQNLPLYGGGMGDTLACAGATTLALATGAARIVNDRHWVSDVVLGGAVGFASGYVLPMLLHYRAGPPPPSRDAVTWAVGPWADRSRLGAQWVGLF